MAERTAAEEAHELGALTTAEAAGQLGVPTRQEVEAVVRRAIPFVMVRGVPHVPVAALEDHRLTAY